LSWQGQARTQRVTGRLAPEKAESGTHPKKQSTAGTLQIDPAGTPPKRSEHGQHTPKKEASSTAGTPPKRTEHGRHASKKNRARQAGTQKEASTAGRPSKRNKLHPSLLSVGINQERKPHPNNSLSFILVPIADTARTTATHNTSEEYSLSLLQLTNAGKI
jgi:hypothetical protein